MSSTPISPPLPSTTPAAEAPPEKSTGTVMYHAACRYHGDLGVFKSEPDALEAAAEHLRAAHSAVVELKLDNAEVEISQVKHFGVSDLAGYEPPKPPTP
jgi:hypothetical protein